jgi:hypothetical protein
LADDKLLRSMLMEIGQKKTRLQYCDRPFKNAIELKFPHLFVYRNIVKPHDDYVNPKA